MNQAKIFAISLDWEVAFHGNSKGNRHLFRVARITKHIALREKAVLNTCLASAWLHDIGLILGNQNHPQTGSLIAKCFLKSNKASSKQLREIGHCIEAHEGKIKFNTLEAKIVHDADVIDKLGVLGLIRHTWKITQSSSLSKSQITNIVFPHINKRLNHLQTKTGQEIGKFIQAQLSQCFNSKKQLHQFLLFIIPLCKKKLTSDKIAKKIIDNSNSSKISLLLKSQINTSFLKNL